MRSRDAHSLAVYQKAIDNSNLDILERLKILEEKMELLTNPVKDEVDAAQSQRDSGKN